MTAVSVSFLIISLAASLSAAPITAAPDKREKTKVIIGYKAKPGKAERARLKRQNEAKIRFVYKNINAIAVTMPRGQLKAVRARKNVKRVEIDHPLTLFDHSAATGDPELEQSWGVEHIGGGRVHASGNMGSPVRAAVIDTGIYCAHPDVGPNCDGGVSYVSASWDDDHGHGTHVSGILAGVRDSSGIVGVAPQVRLIGMKVLDASGMGDYSGLIAALDQITTWNTDGIAGNDVDVVNMSLGGHEPSVALQASAQAAAGTGAILVAASGNVNPFDIWELIYGCPVVYPAAYTEVLSTTFTNGNDALTGYSCTGPEVDFSGPGDLVVSSVPPVGPLSSTSGYLAASGTSMASPHLAGTVALLLSHGMTDTNGNGLRDEIESHLCATADVGFGVLSTPIPPSDPRYPEYFGCGVINAGAALVDDPPGGGPPADDPPIVEAGPDVGGTEGAAVALAGSVIDEGSPTIAWSAVPATCTFGDASAPVTTVTCPDDGIHTLTLTADDGVNPAVADTTTLTLTNVAPSVDAGPDQTVTDGDSVTLAATFGDPGSADTHTATVDWGEGAGPQPVSPGPGSVADSHTYAAPGSYSVTVSVTDDELDSGSDTLTVTVDAVGSGELTVLADADAFVSSRRASRNYGSSKRLDVRNGRRRAFVRFDVSGVDGPVENATLRLYLVDAGGVGTAYEVTQPWSETGITWANQPGPAGGPYPATNPSAPRGTWVAFDVTAAVSGNGPHSFLITDGSSDRVKYHSREAANDPELVIIFSPGASTGSTSIPSASVDTEGPAVKPGRGPKGKTRIARGKDTVGQADLEPSTGSDAPSAPATKETSTSRPKDTTGPGSATKVGKKKPDKARPTPPDQARDASRVGDKTKTRSQRTEYAFEPNPLAIELVSLAKDKRPDARMTIVTSDDGVIEWVVRSPDDRKKARGKPLAKDAVLRSLSEDALSVTLRWPESDDEVVLVFEDGRATLEVRGQTYVSRARD